MSDGLRWANIFCIPRFLTSFNVSRMLSMLTSRSISSILFLIGLSRMSCNKTKSMLKKFISIKITAKLLLYKSSKYHLQHFDISEVRDKWDIHFVILTLRFLQIPKKWSQGNQFNDRQSVKTKLSESIWLYVNWSHHKRLIHVLKMCSEMINDGVLKLKR